MIVVVDNYDSFTYNLVQYLGECGAQIRVFRNDQVTVDQVARLDPSHIVISPGPGAPRDGGISGQVIRQLYREIPILGVCLGHQCIGEAFGGIIARAPRLMHGKTSLVYHDARSIYEGVPNPFLAGRYHSLVVTEPLPDELIVTAYTEQGEVMGIRHKGFPLEGVQFHPESVLTEYGKRILDNFVRRGGER